MREETGERYEPALTRDGRFQLADPAYGSVKHHSKHAVYADTLDEALELVRSKGFSLWMRGADTNQRNLIAPSSIQVK